jgi:Putative esterase
MVKQSQLLILAGIMFLAGCHPKIKETQDEIYSRHLQKHISLTVISTPVPKNKSDFDLLILNNGQNIQKEGIVNIVVSLYRKKLINPLVIVGVHAFDPEKEYGVSGFTDGKNIGSLASKYADFVVNELLPFVKKKSGVRSFSTVSIAGSGMAGVSAIDIAWDNWQKFDKVGFLPGFIDSSANADFSVLAEKISKSRKRPKLQFWLNQMDDMRNSQRNDSTGMEKLFDVLNTKSVDGLSRVGTEEDKNRVIPFSDSFSQFLTWLNQG